MDARLPSYIEIIAEHYPGLQVGAQGDGRDYDSLQAAPGQVLPSKTELDLKIGETLQEITWKKIQEIRDYRRQGGVMVDDKWYHTDDPSRIQQLGLVLMGQNMPPGIAWKTMDGSFVQMTPALALQLFQASAQHDQEVFAVAEQHRAALMEAPNALTYDYSTGWPAIYDESTEPAELNVLQGPQGVQGPQGEQGPAGPPGIPG